MKPSTEDKTEGKIHEVKGAVRQAVGQLTDDPKMEADGKTEKTLGKIQNLVGKGEKVIGE